MTTFERPALTPHFLLAKAEARREEVLAVILASRGSKDPGDPRMAQLDAMLRKGLARMTDSEWWLVGGAGGGLNEMARDLIAAGK